jgi:hypothetical protein
MSNPLLTTVSTTSSSLNTRVITTPHEGDR